MAPPRYAAEILMRGALLWALVLLSLLLAACGGGDRAEGGGGERLGSDEDKLVDPLPTPGADEVETRLSKAIRDPGVGYSLRVPGDWQSGNDDGSVFEGPGEGCFVLPTGPLPDLTQPGARLQYVRDLAKGAQDPGGPKVKLEDVRPEQGVDTAGASAFYREGPDSTRIALFVGAAGGVTLTCTKKGNEKFDRLDAGVLPLVLASFSLLRERGLVELQPRVARIEGVSGASLRRQRTAVLVTIRVAKAPDIPRALEQAMTLVARALRKEEVAGIASAADDPRASAYGRVPKGTRRGYVEGGGGPRREFAVGG